MSELGLVLSVTLVRSAENRADALSRVPRDWVHSDLSPAAPETAAGCGAAETDSAVSSLGDSALSPVTAAEGAENRAACAGSERICRVHTKFAQNAISSQLVGIHLMRIIPVTIPYHSPQFQYLPNMI